MFEDSTFASQYHVNVRVLLVSDACLALVVPSQFLLGSHGLPDNTHLPSLWAAVKIKSEEKEEDMKWNNVVGKFPCLYP